MDEYADGLLSVGQVLAMRQHAAGCGACQQRLAQQDELVRALRAMPAPPMRPGFAQQVLKRAVEQKQHHRRGFATGFSTALAAGVALWVVASFMMPSELPPEGVAQVRLALYQESTVNLAFYSPKAVAEATLSITLPENVELVGFPGERVISWQTSLTEGQNILPLPLRANAQVNSPLLASIESGGSKKSFQLQIGVSEPGRSGSVPLLKNMV
jgi:hypothetical protein